MTTFRFRAVCLTLFLSSCAENMPAAETDLGKIVRIDDYRAASAQLKRFTERRLDDRAALRREFETAGFQRSTYREADGIECESFRWRGMDWGQAFPSVLLVSICGSRVFADAGMLAP